MVAVTIGEWHLRLTCGIIFATHIAFLGFVIWKRPYVHDFLNRMTICSTIEILIAYACAYNAIVIDDPFSPTSATIYTRCALVVLGIYLALEVVLFVSAGAGGNFAMAPDFGGVRAEGDGVSRDNAGPKAVPGGIGAAIGVHQQLEPEPEPEPEPVVEALEEKPTYRIKIKTACRAGKETNTPVTGSLLPGAIVTGLDEDVNSSGVRRIRNHGNASS